MGDLKHTETPWIAKGETISQSEDFSSPTMAIAVTAGAFHVGAGCTSDSSGPVVREAIGTCEANAELIVRAVNAHDEMIEALLEAKQYAEERLRQCYPENEGYHETMISSIDAALAKATDSNV